MKDLEQQMPAPVPERGPKDRVESPSTPEEIRKYFDFADPVLGVDWGPEGAPEAYTPEYIAAHPEETQVFVMRDPNGELAAGSKVTKLSDETKDRLGFDKGEYEGKDGALLEYVLVRDDQRGGWSLYAMGGKMIEWAKEHGAEYLATEVELTNPVSAHLNTRAGFEFVGVKGPGEGIPAPYLVAAKPVADSGRAENPSAERKTVTVTADSEQELAGLFAEGFVGVSADLAKTDGKDDPSLPWTLTMEKR